MCHCRCGSAADWLGDEFTRRSSSACRGASPLRLSSCLLSCFVNVVECFHRCCDRRSAWSVYCGLVWSWSSGHRPSSTCVVPAHPGPGPCVLVQPHEAVASRVWPGKTLLTKTVFTEESGLCSGSRGGVEAVGRVGRVVRCRGGQRCRADY
jgi:hypothetical protein